MKTKRGAAEFDRLKLPALFDPGELDAYRKAFEGGDANALIQAIRICFVFEEVAPQWVAAAFLSATNKWYALEVKELGEAFGVTFPKGAHLTALRKQQRLRWAVIKAIEDAEKSGRAIDEELFEQIGEKLHIGKTAVKQYYKSARELLWFQGREKQKKTGVT